MRNDHTDRLNGAAEPIDSVEGDGLGEQWARPDE